MNIFKNLVYIVAIVTATITLMLVTWNKGWDNGYKGGYVTGMFQQFRDGKLVVECHFKCRPGRCRQTPHN